MLSNIKWKVLIIVLSFISRLVLAAGWSVGVKGDLYVSVSGNDEWSGTNSLCVAPDGPKATIQAAIDAADEGNTIVVSPGTYTGNINFNGKNIVLTSTNPNDWATVAATVIQGDGTNSVVSFAGTETADCRLTGFTITGGGAAINGGGISGNQTSAGITQCIIEDNQAADKGGGAADCQGIIDRCIIRHNATGGDGGGLADCCGTISKCLIYGNIAATGGGVNNCDGVIQSCTVVSNSASALGGGIANSDGSIRNCIVWDNTPDSVYLGRVLNYCCIAGWQWGGTGNRADNPLFVDEAHGDYRLPLSSPCIDAGDPHFVPQPDETDFDGNPRVLNGRVDMGPYEFSGHLRPVARAGLTVYMGTDPVQLDGTGSYDPDHSGTLTYQWRQISGPAAVMTGADTPTPTISGLALTNSLQYCEFELVVDNGWYESRPDRVSLIAVHNTYTQIQFRIESGVFDPEKPTVVFFGRGGKWNSGVSPEWNRNANILSEITDSTSDYFQAGDRLMTYLSAMTPHYSQPIQMAGLSAGGWAAIRVGNYMNRTFQDRRYAINHLVLFDGNDYMDMQSFILSAVDGEPCWIENYVGIYANSWPWAMNVEMYKFGHGGGGHWYDNSLTNIDKSRFISPVAGPGVIAGAYWSVIGPGKNLNLGGLHMPSMFYRFQWEGDYESGYMDFYNESQSPGRLPEPVTLVRRVDAHEPDQVMLTCKPCHNVIGYQLLVGSDPYRVSGYHLLSDTPSPPDYLMNMEIIPEEGIWWTIRAYDQYGATIYADPRYFKPGFSSIVTNMRTGEEFPAICDALNLAENGDEIVAAPGVYHENINFMNMNILLRSSSPDDPTVVAGTVIQGDGTAPVVTFGGSETDSCELRGFKITGGSAYVGGGVFGNFAHAKLRQCIIDGNQADYGGVGWFDGVIDRCQITNNVAAIAGGGISGCRAAVKNCLIASNTAAEKGGGICWGGNISHCTIANNTVVNGDEGAKAGGALQDCTGIVVTDCIIWGNSQPQVNASPVAITYSCIQNGEVAGRGNIAADPLFANPASGNYHLCSQAGRWDADAGQWVCDAATSPCIDAGNPGEPLGDEPADPANLRVDMGADGGTAWANKTPVGWALLPDLDNDTAVNLADFSQMGIDWLQSGANLPGDLNRDGAVDVVDLSVLFADWLTQADRD